MAVTAILVAAVGSSFLLRNDGHEAPRLRVVPLTTLNGSEASPAFGITAEDMTALRWVKPRILADRRPDVDRELHVSRRASP
jgi:hypothetical protein